MPDAIPVTVVTPVLNVLSVEYASVYVYAELPFPVGAVQFAVNPVTVILLAVPIVGGLDKVVTFALVPDQEEVPDTFITSTL